MGRWEGGGETKTGEAEGLSPHPLGREVHSVDCGSDVTVHLWKSEDKRQCPVLFLILFEVSFFVVCFRPQTC